MAAEITHEAITLELVDQALAFVQVNPDAEVEGGLVDARVQVIAGEAAEALVDFNQQPITLARQQQAIG
ncbi:hypothetical protein D3C76_929960 [compost metagenome]